MILAGFYPADYKVSYWC